MPNKEWFASWFDSPYYHKLYDHRDYSEAELFISNLITYLAPPKSSRALDLACGKGRHSAQLAKNGLKVTGVDLSQESIDHAISLNIDNTSFYTHDMRKPFRINYYNYIFNLFTSFGYFDAYSDNISMLSSIKSGLKKDGIAIIDFFNANKVISNLVQEEQIIKGDTIFDITRNVIEGKIVKTISFKDENDNQQYFEEKVSAFTLEDFDRFFRDTGFSIKSTFGDYNLNDFDFENSPRLILVIQEN